jgi:hypothetical protein
MDPTPEFPRSPTEEEVQAALGSAAGFFAAASEQVAAGDGDVPNEEERTRYTQPTIAEEVAILDARDDALVPDVANMPDEDIWKALNVDPKNQ